ncbi:co-chaperone protein HscB [Hyalella azteca]|uniref:Co-chaperone protein HscB n=1 Tax=Hyalella azteca TaxID=294128 RepID=A0A8B7PCH5_HYAAZ|nr:co-chaperone protein HscB [Hyalella azteca]
MSPSVNIFSKLLRPSFNCWLICSQGNMLSTTAVNKLNCGLKCQNVVVSKHDSLNRHSWLSCRAISISKQHCCKNTRTEVYCWKCQKLLSGDERFCPSCNIIQPLKDGLNYFELLGVEKQFLCDCEHLANQFRNLQRLYHPDKFASASEKEQEISASYSSAINKAYQVLNSALARAQYLLSLENLSLQEDHIDMDKEFLLEVMELNEELAGAQTEAQIAELKQTAQGTFDDLMG